MTATRSVLARTVTGAGWVIAWRLGMRVLGLISTLVLVRLLVPADFGLLALAASFAQTVDGMMTLGTEEAVIRQIDPDRNVYDTAWTLNVIRGLTVAAIVVVSAVPVARFLRRSATGDGAVGHRSAAIVRRTVEYRHRRFPPRDAVPEGIRDHGGAETVRHRRHADRRPDPSQLHRAAVRHRHQPVLRSVMSYVMHPFRPRFSLRAWRGLVGYSVWTWLLSLAILLRNRSDTLLLGRLTNSTSVGVYAIGSEVASLPTSELVEPLCRASFAGFAAAHREGVVVTETFLRLLSSAVIVTLPAGLGLALVAAPLVRLAFGPGWDAAVPVLRVLGVAGIMSVFGQISLHLMSAHSLLGRLTALALAGAGVRIVLLLALIPPFGVTGAAWAAAIATCIEQGATLMMALRRLRIGDRCICQPCRAARRSRRRRWRAALSPPDPGGRMPALPGR